VNTELGERFQLVTFGAAFRGGGRGVLAITIILEAGRHDNGFVYEKVWGFDSLFMQTREPSSAQNFPFGSAATIQPVSQSVVAIQFGFVGRQSWERVITLALNYG
jgi:hypothetical protein